MISETEKQIIEYCKPHLDQMWAATIVGIVLDCDFRDARTKLNDLLAKIFEAQNGERCEICLKKDGECGCSPEDFADLD